MWLAGQPRQAGRGGERRAGGEQSESALSRVAPVRVGGRGNAVRWGERRDLGEGREGERRGPPGGGDGE